MINRWIGIVSAILMLSANAMLLRRDVLPSWFASDPPRARALDLKTGGEINYQYGIFDGSGRRLGYSWNRNSRSLDVLTSQTVTVIQSFSLTDEVALPAICIELVLTYVEGDMPDSLNMRIRGLATRIEVRGEKVSAGSFPCEWRIGEQRGTFVLDPEATRSLGDSIRPFDGLEGLYEGQSWRIRLLNPLAAIIPGAEAERLATREVLVQVTGVETIEGVDGPIDAHVVEAENVRGWFAPDGRLVRQEVTVPLLGVLSLQEEPYDGELRRRILRAGPSQ